MLSNRRIHLHFILTADKFNIDGNPYMNAVVQLFTHVCTQNRLPIFLPSLKAVISIDNYTAAPVPRPSKSSFKGHVREIAYFSFSGANSLSL